MKPRILIVALVMVGSFTGGLAISKYRQSAAITINYTLTNFNDDGTISDSSKIVRICNRRGEWSQTQIFSDGKLRVSNGKVTPREESLSSFPNATRKAILGRAVVVFSDRRSEAWYDPSLHDFLKTIIYTDDTKQTVGTVIEAVEIKE